MGYIATLPGGRKKRFNNKHERRKWARVASTEGDVKVATLLGCQPRTVARWRYEFGLPAASRRNSNAGVVPFSRPKKGLAQADDVAAFPGEVSELLDLDAQARFPQTGTIRRKTTSSVRGFIRTHKHQPSNTLSQTAARWSDLVIARRLVADRKKRFLRVLAARLETEKGLLIEPGGDPVRFGEEYNESGIGYEMSLSKPSRKWRKNFKYELQKKVLEHLWAQPDARGALAAARDLVLKGKYSIDGMRSAGINPYEKGSDGSYKYMSSFTPGTKWCVVPDASLSETQKVQDVLSELEMEGFRSELQYHEIDATLEDLAFFTANAFQAEQEIRSEIAKHELSLINARISSGKSDVNLPRSRTNLGKVVRSGSRRGAWNHDKVFDELLAVSNGDKYRLIKLFFEVHTDMPWKMSAMEKTLGVDIKESTYMPEPRYRFKTNIDDRNSHMWVLKQG